MQRQAAVATAVTLPTSSVVAALTLGEPPDPGPEPGVIRLDYFDPDEPEVCGDCWAEFPNARMFRLHNALVHRLHWA